MSCEDTQLCLSLLSDVANGCIFRTLNCDVFLKKCLYFRLGESIPGQCIDVASLIFVLSAIHPDNFTHALQNIAEVLRPSGVLVFRDYGLYDMAQIRFGRGKKLADNFYVRQDGTRHVFNHYTFLSSTNVLKFTGPTSSRWERLNDCLLLQGSSAATSTMFIGGQ